MTYKQLLYTVCVFLLGGIVCSSITFFNISKNKIKEVKKEIKIQEDTTIYLPVKITIFHPGTAECGAGVIAYTCADGYVINSKKPIRLVGLSTDLLKICPYKDSIYLNIPQAPYLNNYYIVHTTCKSTLIKCVDICIFDKNECDIKGSWKGFIRTTIKKIKYNDIPY